MKVGIIFLQISGIVFAAPMVPPDTSLATLPVAYYGAQWKRPDVNIEMLSKQHIVMLMQEDGDCWTTCCPNVAVGGQNKCNQTNNATSIPGCGPQCDQHGKQNHVFERVKAMAKKAGRRPPHCMLYLNAVYDFPFSSTHSFGIDLTDIHGKPHMENCDPGIFPSFFFDFGRSVAQQAWLDILRRAVVNGSADGVYIDCYMTNPIHCEPNATTCIAKRNGKFKSINEVVTLAQAQAYITGKAKTLKAGAELVGPLGSYYAKSAPMQKPAPYGGNLHFLGKKDLPWQLIEHINKTRPFYKYIVVGAANDYSSPTRDPSDPKTLKSKCKEGRIATFLLAVEPGCFLLCNGWDPLFSRPLGLPRGPAVCINATGGVCDPDKYDVPTNTWTRHFVGGTNASWIGGINGTGTVTWAPTQTLN